jgi:hypothetical protein
MDTCAGFFFLINRYVCHRVIISIVNAYKPNLNYFGMLKINVKLWKIVCFLSFMYLYVRLSALTVVVMYGYRVVRNCKGCFKWFYECAPFCENSISYGSIYRLEEEPCSI